MINATILQRIGIVLLIVGLVLRLAGRQGYLPSVAGYIDLFYWSGLALWGLGFITRKKQPGAGDES